MLPRLLLPHVTHSLEGNAAVAILGPRQVGKTTLARTIAGMCPSIYLDLQDSDDVAKLANAKEFLTPHLDKLKAKVLVPDLVAQTDDLLPRYFGVAVQHLRRQMVDGLTDSLERIVADLRKWPIRTEVCLTSASARLQQLANRLIYVVNSGVGYARHVSKHPDGRLFDFFAQNRMKPSAGAKIDLCA